MDYSKKWTPAGKLCSYSSGWIPVKEPCAFVKKPPSKARKKTQREEVVDALAKRKQDDYEMWSATKKAVYDVLVHGLTAQEAADKHGLSMLNVRQRVWEARKKIKQGKDWKNG